MECCIKYLAYPTSSAGVSYVLNVNCKKCTGQKRATLRATSRTNCYHQSHLRTTERAQTPPYRHTRDNRHNRYIQTNISYLNKHTKIAFQRSATLGESSRLIHPHPQKHRNTLARNLFATTSGRILLSRAMI